MKRIIALIAVLILVPAMAMGAGPYGGPPGGATGNGNVTASGSFTSGHVAKANNASGTELVDGGTLATDNSTASHNLAKDASGNIINSPANRLATFYWDGGGSAITAGAGTKRCMIMAAGGTITGIYAIADAVTNTTVINAYKDASAGLFTGGALATTDMTGGNNITINNKIGMVDTTLTGWTTSKTITAGDEICAYISANTGSAKWVGLMIYGTQ